LALIFALFIYLSSGLSPFPIFRLAVPHLELLSLLFRPTRPNRRLQNPGVQTPTQDNHQGKQSEGIQLPPTWLSLASMLPTNIFLYPNLCIISSAGLSESPKQLETVERVPAALHVSTVVT
jgi:O-antigen ligase